MLGYRFWGCLSILHLTCYDENLPLFLLCKSLTARVTGGWGETGLKTGNCQSSETTPKNAHSPSHPVHAVLGGFMLDIVLKSQFSPYSFSCIVIFVSGRKRVMAVMKHKTFDTALRANGNGEEG
jgi:hypothetical protein